MVQVTGLVGALIRLPPARRPTWAARCAPRSRTTCSASPSVRSRPSP